MNRIDKIHTDHPYYGARRISVQLIRDTQQIIGRKRCKTLMEKMGINVVIHKPNQVAISMDHRGRCFDNIFTERLWRSVKYDEVYIGVY